MKLVRTAVVVAALAVSLMPTTAFADTYLHNDATADVVSFSSTSADAAAPDEVNGDIVWSKVRHRARKVVLTMRYRDLDGSGYTVHYFAIRTSKMTRQVSLVTFPGHLAGKAVMTNARDKQVTCRVRRDIDYVANTATVVVPRSCLGRPRWVKVGMAMVTSPSKTFSTGFADDARTHGDFNSPGWSPRVYR